MALKHFHLLFLTAALSSLAFTAAWAAGVNSAGLVTPWALGAALTGALMTLPYAVWFWRRAKELR